MTDAATRRIGTHFGRAAREYDAHAQLQLSSARTLAGLLPSALPEGMALDLGCGTGPVARRLSEDWPQRRWLALDVSADMLREGVARGRFPQAMAPVCADAARLPLADCSVALMFSSFALQWCPDRAALVRELARVLRPEGVLALCLPVQGTLEELRQAWAAVDDQPHVNGFAAAACWQEDLTRVGLVPEHLHQGRVVEHYGSLQDLVGRLRGTGANQVLRREGARGVGVKALRRLEQAYESRREPAGLPLSWQILFGIFRALPG